MNWFEIIGRLAVGIVLGVSGITAFAVLVAIIVDRIILMSGRR